MYKIYESVAFLDLICSFTTYVSLHNGMVRPSLNPRGAIAVSNGVSLRLCVGIVVGSTLCLCS